MVTESCHYDDAIDLVSEHPTCDVAFAFLRPDVGRELAPLAIPFAQLESDAVWRIERNAPLVAAGFPRQFTTRVPLADGSIEHRFTAFLKYTTIHNHDDRHLSIDWREAYPIDRGKPPAHPALDVEPGKPVFLKKPTWLSGGPVYRVIPAVLEEFHAVNQCRLVAVATEFTQGQCELAVPWWRWRDWLLTG